MDEVLYTLDHDWRLASVNGAWDRFAIENDAPELAARYVIGRPLLDFITGPEARHLTTVLMQRAISTGEPVIVPFSCHASHERRHMEMTVTPTPTGLQFRTRTRRVTVIPEATELLTRGRLADDDLITLCSWCNRVRVEDRWVEIEEAADLLRFLDRPVLPAVTHGICQGCSTRVLDDWKATQGRVRT